MLNADTPSRAAVTWRSVLLGLAGVIFICSLSPYNDWVVANTFLIGNFMPIGLLLFFFLVVMALNAPLLRWWPGAALSSRELTVSMGMTLVACGFPGAGMMRYLPTQLVGIWYWGGSSTNPEYTALLKSLNLPDWLFPAFTSGDPTDRARAAVVQNYYGRIPVRGDTFWSHVTAVPWSLWAHPALAWGLFTFALLGAMFCLLLIVRRQWSENERLSFPLASIYAAIIEPPERGRSLNRLFSNRSFWIAFGLVFAWHSCNAMRNYYPRYFPLIPTGFNLTSIFTNEPWVFLEWDFRITRVYFCVIGICYFLPSQISLSIWLFYVLYQIEVMVAGTYRVEITKPMMSDQFMGALVPYALALVWVGRQHWATVIRQMFRGAKPGESIGRYLPYAAAGWGFIAFLLLGVIFLCAAGASVIGALACMLMVLTLHLCVARIVAETGIPFVNFNGNVDRPWYALLDSDGHGARTTTKSFFLTQMVASSYSNDIRESPAVYTSHAYRLADDMYPDPTAKGGFRRTLPFTFCIVLAMIVGFGTAGASKLYTEYTYSVSLDEQQRSPLDNFGTDTNVRDNVLKRSQAYATPRGPIEAHSRLKHLGIGAAVSLALSVARLTSVSFPLHPVGFLLGYTWPVSQIWFAMFVGWLVKTIIVKLGGTELHRKFREAFIGLILGEAGAAAFWLLVALALNAMGFPFKSINFLPG